MRVMSTRRFMPDMILIQLRLSSFVAKATHPSPIKGEGSQEAGDGKGAGLPICWRS